MPATTDHHLPVRAPYDFDALLGFLAARTIDGVEVVADGRYARAVRSVQGDITHAGWIEVTRADGGLRLSASAGLADALPDVVVRTQRLFDTEADPAVVAAALGPLAVAAPGLRRPGAFDGFELAVRAVLGQQITVKAARTLAGRFARAFGAPVATTVDGLDALFPTPARVAKLDVPAIASLGVIRSRATAILAIASAIAAGDLVLDPSADVPTQLDRLRALPGIGEWTAQYIAMRALRWDDAFPHSDYGVKKALGTTADRQTLAAAEAWRPWRAYAVMHLWRSLA